MGTGDVVLVVLALAGQTNSATTLDLFLPTSGDRPFYGAMVERRVGPSWLHDDDDNDKLLFLYAAVFRKAIMFPLCSVIISGVI